MQRILIDSSLLEDFDENQDKKIKTWHVYMYLVLATIFIFFIACVVFKMYGLVRRPSIAELNIDQNEFDEYPSSGQGNR